jgi:hypothetical protein
MSTPARAVRVPGMPASARSTSRMFVMPLVGEEAMRASASDPTRRLPDGSSAAADATAVTPASSGMRTAQPA